MSPAERSVAIDPKTSAGSLETAWVLSPSERRSGNVEKRWPRAFLIGKLKHGGGQYVRKYTNTQTTDRSGATKAHIWPSSNKSFRRDEIGFGKLLSLENASRISRPLTPCHTKTNWSCDGEISK
jgi:hypothetical protein